ncbi:MAG TPA: hypothetical protein VF913_16820 [Xanthobacteraceae bacterium]
MPDGFEKVIGGDRFYSAGWIARKIFGRHPRTLNRWRKDPRVGFPPADAVILGRRYWRGRTIAAFEQHLAQSKTAADKPNIQEIDEIPAS